MGEAEQAFFRLVGDPVARANPYPVYEEIRRAPSALAATTGFWLITGHSDCAQLLRHPLLKRRHGDSWEARAEFSGGAGRPWFAEQSQSMLWLDNPDHGRLRGLVSKAFTPRYLSALKPQIEDAVKELIDKIVDKGETDIIADLALPLPMRVICGMLGVPEKDRESFRKWTVALAATLEPLPSEPVQDAADKAVLGFYEYFTDLIAERKGSPGDDLLSRLIEVEQAGDGLSSLELIGVATLLLGAGFETTTNLIGNGTLALMQQRDQWEALVSDPSLAPNAVEEILRFDSPVQVAPPRIASQDFTHNGFDVEESHTIVCLIAAGNRDPEKFEDPAKLDIQRKDPAPLSFGGGPHYCLGAALARIEGAAVFKAMAERIPDLELTTDEPEWRETFNLRGLKALPAKI